MTISGATTCDSIDFGANLLCSVSASPSATYQWFNYTELLILGPSIRITGVGNYTCEAWNTIDEQNFSTSLTQNIVAGEITI